MSDVTNLLDSYAQAGNAFLDPKISQVAATAEAKRADLILRGYAGAAANAVGVNHQPTADDLLNPDALAAVTQSTGAANYKADSTADRTLPQAITDSAISAGTAALRTIPDIANIAVGAVDADAGAALTRTINQGQDFSNSLESDGLNARRRANAARNQVTSDIHAQEYRDAGGGLVAGLKRIGKDALSAVQNMDDVTGSDLVANGAGSMLVAGPMGRAFKAAGIAEHLATPLSIGLQEAGGAYNQSATQVLNMSHDQLMQSSPDYQQLIYSGLSPTEARNQVARNAGEQAAAIQGPIAAVTGKFVSKFEEHPFHVGSLGEAAGNILKEGVEEGVQSGTGQLAQNFAVQQNANQNQDLLDGVGEQIAEGSLSAMGSAGATQAPGAALHAAAQAVRLPAEAISNRVSSLTSANEKASPISPENVRAAYDAAQAAAPEIHQTVSQAIDQSDAAPEAKQQAQDHLNTLMSSAQFDPAMLQDPAMPGPVRSALDGSTDRFDAVQRLVNVIDDKATDPTDQLSAASYLRDLVQKDNLVGKLQDAVEAIPDDHPALPMLRDFEDSILSVGNSSNVRKVMGQIDDIAQSANEAGKIAPVSEQELSTPAGQQAVRNTLAVAEMSPINANPEANAQLLLHAEQGRVQITPAQRQALQASSALVQAHRDYLANIEKQGLTSNTDIVSDEIVSRDSGQGKRETPSAAEHIKQILASVRAGDTETAADQLHDFTLFAQHMQNKVAALNENLANRQAGDTASVHYQALMPLGRKWIKSVTGLGVTPHDAKSVRFAQTVGNEANTLSTLANSMVKIFPDLGVKPVKAVALDPVLASGTPDAVAEGFRNALATDTAEQAKPAEQAPVAASEAETAPAEAPKIEEPKVAETVAEKPKPEPKEADQPAPQEQPKQEAAPEATSEPAAKADAQPEPEPKVSEEAPATPGLTDRLKKFFRIPKEPKTRIFGDEAPLDTIRKVLSSEKALETHLGTGLNKDFSPATAKDYAEYLGYADKIKQVLSKRLEDYLSKEVNSKQAGRKDTRENLFRSGDLELDRTLEGRVLNLTQEQDGKLVYSPEHLDSAVLAGLQWMLSFRQFMTKIDDESLQQVFGISSDQLVNSSELVDELNSGLSATVAKRSLADMIKDYWGLSSNDTAPQGPVEGIPEGMAGEILEALVELKHLDFKTVTLEGTTASEDGSEQDTLKTPDIYWPVREKTDEDGKKVLIPGIVDPESDINAFPDAIERAVMMTPRRTNFIGEEPKNVPDTQLRNPEVKLKPSQKAAIKAKQATKHFVNLPMVNFLTALGHDNVLQLFGAGDLSNRLLNKQHRASLEGQNRSFSSAFFSLVGLMKEVQNVADRAGTELDETPIYYERSFTRVNRMQMLGLDNPQASKLMREAVLPTRSTLDLSSQTGTHFSAYSLALAQHLGVKIETQSQETSSQKVMALLNGDLAKSVELLQDWLTKGGNLPEGIVDTLKSELGGKMSVGAVHAVMDYARYLNADAEERKAFKTSLYLEADGKTNGPINAMALLTPGSFTGQWLANIRKGGLSFGRQGQTMNLIHQVVDSSDLYTTVSRVLQNLMTDQVSKVSGDEDMSRRMTSLGVLMTELLGGDAVFDGQNFMFDRGIAKNPLTITIYGSGERGIANKMAGQLIDKMYERMSDALGRFAQDNSLTGEQAMFPGLDPQDAKRKLEEFQSAVQALTGARLSSNIADFKFGKDAIKGLQKNVHSLFVKPLRASIENTIGQGVMNAAVTLRQAVQIQSIALQYAFKRKVEQMLAEKAKDPSWHENDFLSQQELRDAWQSLSDLAPLIDTKDQSWYIAGRDKADVGVAQFSRSLSGGFRSDAFVRGPSNAGVAGIPAMVIGAGDGLMMQLLAAHEDVAARTLDVFDGLNLPLDMAQDFSQKANQAVFQTWMGNPLQAVNTSFSTFLGALSLEEASAEEMQEYLKALGLKGEKVTTGQLEQMIQGVGKDLSEMALDAEARHNAIARVGLTVDQMASASSPYEHEGEVSVEGMDDRQVVQQLNQLYAEERAKLVEEKSEAVDNQVEKSADKSEDISTELNNVGRLLKSGVRKIAFSGVRNLARMLNIPEDQRAVLGDVLRSLATKDYTLVHGTPEQIRAYAEERGLDTVSEQTYSDNRVNGFISPNDRTIYLHNATSETLVHELIHAATLDKIQAYYAGEDLGPNSAEQVAAIKRIEGLLKQTAGLDISKEDAATQKAWNDMLHAVEGHQLSGRFAEGLNEFMAWSLANANLQALQKKTAVSSPLVQLARQAVDFLKRLIWGRKQMPPIADDMLSNLRWNTNILLQTKRTAREAFQDTILFHNESYGQDDRLVELNRTINQKVVRHLSESVHNLPEGVRQQTIARRAAAILASSDLALSVADNGFPMTAQERTTFQTLVTVLGTTIEIDPNALSRVQELFVHVAKTLKVEDFMKTDPEAFDQNDRHQAQQKYDVIVGNYQVDTDKQGRSSLLPQFLALAVVNDDFRQVLSKMALPKGSRNQEGTIDARLENFGNDAMDKLTTYLSGEGRAPNVQAAIDALTQKISDVAEDRQAYFDQMVSPAGDFIDGANKFVVDGIQRLAELASDKAEKIKASSTNKYVQAGASLLNAVVGIVSEDGKAAVGEGLMSLVNKGDMPKALAEFFGDLVGRTKNTAAVYDMIKRVRSYVQQRRQQFRESLPKVIAKKFSRELTAAEWTHLHQGLGKTDFASLRERFSEEEVLQMLQSGTTITDAISELEGEAKGLDPKNFGRVLDKAKQLAHFMNTGEAGSNLLRNAYAVSHLLGEGVRSRNVSADLIKTVDHLTTLYALETLPQETKDTLAKLAKEEVEGMTFTTSYLVGQRVDEMAKAYQGAAQANHYKGWLPSENRPSVTMIVADDANYSELAAKSFVRVGDYKGSSLERGNVSRGYYFAPVSGRAPYNQGILQNVRQTAYGVDAGTGLTHGLTAGRITNAAAVQRIWQSGGKENATSEPLLPVYDGDGKVVAYERAIDPAQLSRLGQDTHLAKMIGVWRGRQLEELEARHVNEQLIDRLHEMYQADLKEEPRRQAEYVDLLDPRQLKKDPVLADAVSLFTPETHAYIEQTFGNHFYVRKDMLNDAVGYRTASIGDAWTGISRLKPEVLESTQRLAISIFGNNAYKYLVNAEKILRNVVAGPRVAIVVKSVVVPMSNLVSNVYQLVGRGVPIADIARGMPKKAAEVRSYLKSRLRLDEIEAELRTVSDNPVKRRPLEAEAQSIQDAHRRLTIWPLIEAGELSSISDGLNGHDDGALTEGRLADYVEQLVSKLPEPLKVVGRYGIVAKDTALYKGLSLAVEYGDFLGKAILYDELTKRKKLSQEDALAHVTDEFVNYDRLPGRTRGYLENMGLLWFYNFKIRSVKVAASMVRNNPVHSLLSSVIPHPKTFGTIGSPLTDNLFSMGIKGDLGYSIGPGMGLQSHEFNPVVNMLF